MTMHCGTESGSFPARQTNRQYQTMLPLSVSAIEVEINGDTQGPLAYGWIVRTRVRAMQIEANAVGRVALRTLSLGSKHSSSG